MRVSDGSSDVGSSDLTRRPVWTAAISLAINIALNLLLIPRLGIVGLALAGSIAAWCNVAMLYAILHRKGHFRLTGQVAGRIARIIVAAAAMAAALHYAIPLAGDALLRGRWIGRASCGGR